MENKTEEIRIDVSRQTAEELALAKEHAQLVFRLNHDAHDGRIILLHQDFSRYGCRQRGEHATHGGTSALRENRTQRSGNERLSDDGGRR